MCVAALNSGSRNCLEPKSKKLSSQVSSTTGQTRKAFWRTTISLKCEFVLWRLCISFDFREPFILVLPRLFLHCPEVSTERCVAERCSASPYLRKTLAQVVHDGLCATQMHCFFLWPCSCSTKVMPQCFCHCLQASSFLIVPDFWNHYLDVPSRRV